MQKPLAKAPRPAYVPFRTFLTFLTKLESGVPSRIERSFLRDNYSEVIASQLMTSLRFLELVEGEDDRTTATLERLVHERGGRKHVLAELFYERYHPVLARVGDLTACSHSQLAQAFTDLHDVHGETRRKALSFFTHLAQESDIALSEFIRTAQHPGSKRSTQQSKANSGTFLARFRNGGYAMLICTGNPFRLDQKERQFLFDLVDRFREYEQGVESSDEQVAPAQEVTHATEQ